jgi:putative endonuclease
MGKHYYIYMMSNKRNGTLYTGVTNNLIRRVYEHKNGAGGLFTKRYKLTMLIYYEQYDDIKTALQREKNLKHYSRAWKDNLINSLNPQWVDLYEAIL